MLAESMANPFKTTGCIPDGTHGVGCFTLKQIGTLSTGTTGTVFGIAINANPSALFYTDSGNTSASATINGNWGQSTALNTVGSQYDQARVTSMGLKIVYVGNTINDQGTIIVGQVAPKIALGTLNGDGLTTFAASSQYYETYPLRSGAIVTWRPTEMDDMSNFNNIMAGNLTVGSALNTPWLYAYVFGAATAAASSINYEFVVNFEGQIVSQTYIPGGLNTYDNRYGKTPAEPGWYERVLNAIDSVPPIAPYVYSGLNTILNSDAAQHAATSIGNSVGAGLSSALIGRARSSGMIGWR